MVVPVPTLIYRIVHISNIETLLERGGLHAYNFVPSDGLPYRSIHDPEVQAARSSISLSVDPGGVLLDYVPFYFGPRSPMLFKIKSNLIPNCREGQQSIVYLVSTVQTVLQSSIPYIFSDGHDLASLTMWYNTTDNLEQVDWKMVNAQYWADTIDDMDRQRRKQAEFLIYKFCPWSLIQQIAVKDRNIKDQVDSIMNRSNPLIRRDVVIMPSWYY